MFITTIKYKNFEGQDVSRKLYFNMTETELLTLAASVPGGKGREYESMIDDPATSTKAIPELTNLILTAYGEKSNDGESFVKITDEGRPLAQKFLQTAAFDALFLKIIHDEDFARAFILGIVPEELREKVFKSKE